MKTWDYFIDLGPFILSHAGYNGVMLKSLPPAVESLNEMTPDDFTWSREGFYNHKGLDGYITIFGHTPTRNIRAAFNQERSDDVWLCGELEDKIGIDGAIAFGGQLNCINLDAMEFIVIDPKKGS
jgi:serine/threonine protein phosphatase 1